MDYAKYPIWRQAKLGLLDMERAGVKGVSRHHNLTLGRALRHNAMRNFDVFIALYVEIQ